MQKIASILILLSLAFGCSGQSFKHISKRIKSNNQHQNSQFTEKSHLARIELYKTGKLNFLKTQVDTIWFLESQLIESGIILGKIWNKQGAVEYSVEKGKLDFETYKPFTPHVCNLIENWDTASIKKEEKTQDPLINANYIYATRVIKTSKDIKVDTISFTDLFNWKRDTKH